MRIHRQHFLLGYFTDTGFFSKMDLLKKFASGSKQTSINDITKISEITKQNQALTAVKRKESNVLSLCSRNLASVPSVREKIAVT